LPSSSATATSSCSIYVDFTQGRSSMKDRYGDDENEEDLDVLQRAVA
jgi:hypothetical protein